MSHSRRVFLHRAAVGAVGLLPLVAACADAASSDRRRFLRAAAEGDLETVTELLGGAPELLQATDDAGRSAFALAHLGGHPEVGEHLVGAGYAPDLHESALSGDWERFSELTAADTSEVSAHHPVGGDAMVAAALGGAGSQIWRVYAATGRPDAFTGGVTALQTALTYRDLPAAEMTAATLLANDADPGLAGREEDPPLHLAARRGSVELVEMLLRLGADPAAVDRRGRTALEVAHGVAVATMLEHPERIPRTCRTSRTAYDVEGRPYRPPSIEDIPLTERLSFVGKSHFDLDYVREALAREPRLAHSVATTSEIAVEACAHTGRLPVVEHLLEHGASCSLPTAVMRGDGAAVRRLLDEDPRRIHERGAHDFALLWYPVIGGGNVEMMELLLERGAEVEQQHHLGTTALHWAAMRGPIEMVELLLDRGADVNRAGRKFGGATATPLDLAREQDRSEIARLLIERGARSPEA